MRRPGQYSERLQYQLLYKVSPTKAKSKEEAEILAHKAVKHFLETGKSIAGVKIIARWRNPDSSNPKTALWKTTEDPGQSLEDFWKTLHGARGALYKLAERYR